MSADDEPHAPRHIRRFGDPLPGTMATRFDDMLRAELRDLVTLGTELRDLARSLIRRGGQQR